MSWRLGVVAGGLLIVAGAVLVGFRTYDYVENDPRFCLSCHLMESAYGRWQTSVHAKVGCHACHQQSTAAKLDQLWKYATLRPTRVSKHAEVDYTRCAACHLSRDPRWKQIADTAGHRVHFERLGLQCVGCHSKGVHVFVRPTDSCQGCHTQQVTGAGKMAAFHCTTCHDFLARDHELGAPTRAECLTCHATMQVRTERFDPKAPMQFPCQQCHEPHGRTRPTMDGCRTCHHVADFGLHAVPFHQDCQSCHEPHLWRTEARATCERCHTDRAAHHPDAPCASCHGFANPRPARTVAPPPEASS